jgi:hypothetical protein
VKNTSQGKETNMSLNSTFIKQQFKSLASTYNLVITKDSEYVMTFENDIIEIDFGVERWDEEGITAALVNKKKNEFYYPDKLLKLKGINSYQQMFSVQEKVFFETLSGNDSIVYIFRILLDRYCLEVLTGDFSQLGAGTREF